ncbi:SDR family oxidoreductase [Oceanibacterium hippocampi]|uniref:NAD-dependent epimerase/dehydratase domain-containing protein n=1 Tax=Oceanibacterium hippocampi TaxID=745714 RepID=A0A1Y5RRW0_9PROT|nr:SDR family oxidoreductase [Oceanibacterium hippocampi]SLN23518.1 hypothetical protein OCH7691_00642 [Oceanibacterium hippocampi]
MTRSPTKRGPGLFVFGLGFSALVLVRRVATRGWRVGGTCRDAEKAAALRDRGIAASCFGPGIAPPPLADLAGYSHLLLSIPPVAEGDPVLDAYGDSLAGLPDVSWVGYLSTTGVYGDTGGAWVDETAPCDPGPGRSLRRLEAETAWRDFHRRLGLPVHVFRLAGIYGPGRNQLESLRNGTAKRIEKPGQVFSRIHVDDIAEVLEASIARPDPGAVYNVCDDEPAPPGEVIVYAASLLGLEPPPAIPFEAADLSPMARSFYADNRRVRNTRIRKELCVDLRYPTYREGLKALLRSLD